MGGSYLNSYNDDIELGIWAEGTLIAVIMALRWEGCVLYPV
jgi:hypothetical protein